LTELRPPIYDELIISLSLYVVSQKICCTRQWRASPIKFQGQGGRNLWGFKQKFLTIVLASNQARSENYGDPNAKWMRFNRVNCLVYVLHESARSFSHAVESLELSGTGPALAMAWEGKDLHGWHKRIAYKVLNVYIYLYAFFFFNKISRC
jgi:hypothetical protein